MSSGFSKSDLDSFFETDGVGVKGVITGPAVTPPAEQFTRTLYVIFSIDNENVDIYGDSNVAAEVPQFLCKTADLADVKARMTFTMPDVEDHEDGYGKTYEITPRMFREGPQMTR